MSFGNTIPVTCSFVCMWYCHEGISYSYISFVTKSILVSPVDLCWICFWVKTNIYGRSFKSNLSLIVQSFRFSHFLVNMYHNSSEHFYRNRSPTSYFNKMLCGTWPPKLYHADKYRVIQTHRPTHRHTWWNIASPSQVIKTPHVSHFRSNYIFLMCEGHGPWVRICLSLCTQHPSKQSGKYTHISYMCVRVCAHDDVMAWRFPRHWLWGHYSDVKINVMTSHITSFSIVCSIGCSGAH